jgi:hypothetical protein
MAVRSTVLTDPNLHRYWFPIEGHMGVGVTAYSLSEAQALATRAAARWGWPFTGSEVVEDVDIRSLDQRHVVPNIGPSNFHGVWFPADSLS